ncbi:cytochrome c oxidase subunit II [Sphingosinicella sp. CPCC 101087]|uniref:cytochrome c oxidase subunit II n=1 Tax=Sphingosinicella sp. CPCC 101087 TaxID=2497754 RepID=UPI00101D450B|nr:cytochrome c oxidase subunit II [Sphingosinicella sp. CPCC 101087]
MWPRISTPSGIVEGLAGWPPPVLDPAGPYAGSVAALSWALIALAAGIFLIVLAALWIALRGRERLRARLGGERAIWIGGVVFPVVVLTALLIWGLTLTRNLSEPAGGPELRMRVSGEMWWWRVSYLDGNGRAFMQDANELHIPVGRTIAIELVSPDVIHSFWVPQLSGKLDMVPGRRNLIRIQADRPGTYAGICAEYCGGPHALMGFLVVAHAPDDYARWLAARRAPRAAPPDRQSARGAALFVSAGCAACHRIAGTPANGQAGPDLTHVGSRRTLGAGILPNNRGTMIGWIGNSQAIKPGNRMPPYTVLPGEDLQALAAYLEAQR